MKNSIHSIIAAELGQRVPREYFGLHILWPFEIFSNTLERIWVSHSVKSDLAHSKSLLHALNMFDMMSVEHCSAA